MEDEKSILNQIEILRIRLHFLINIKKNLTDAEIIKVNNLINFMINKYSKILYKRQNKD